MARTGRANAWTEAPAPRSPAAVTATPAVPASTPQACHRVHARRYSTAVASRTTAGCIEAMSAEVPAGTPAAAAQ